jgi:hypothetical protein
LVLKSSLGFLRLASDELFEDVVCSLFNIALANDWVQGTELVISCSSLQSGRFWRLVFVFPEFLDDLFRTRLAKLPLSLIESILGKKILVLLLISLEVLSGPDLMEHGDFHRISETKICQFFARKVLRQGQEGCVEDHIFWSKWRNEVLPFCRPNEQILLVSQRFY